MTVIGYASIGRERDADDCEENMSSSFSSNGKRSRRGRKDLGIVGQASWTSSVINLLNTIVGAGVLAMPLALSHMGILLGVCVIIWAGVTAGFGLYLQTQCSRYLDRGTASFFALSQLTYPNASVVFDGAIAIKCFGVGVSYLIIIGDLMPGVVSGLSGRTDETDVFLDRQFWVTAFMLVIIPLSFLRRLDSLKYTSLIALSSIGYLVILILAHFIKGDTASQRGPIRPVEWAGPVPMLASFPVMVFAYTCHQNMFSVLNEINNNSHFNTTSVIIASIGSACATYVLVAITGYLSFGDNIQGNIISMYAPSATSTIGRAAIVILVMFSYPLQVHPCRASIDAILRWRPVSSSSASKPQYDTSNTHHSPLLRQQNSISSSSFLSASPSSSKLLPSTSASKSITAPMSDLRFALTTTIIIILSYTAALTISSLEKVLAYVGSTGSTSISFILPGLFYYKISDPNGGLAQRVSRDDGDDEDQAMSEDDDDDDVYSDGNDEGERGWSIGGANANASASASASVSRSRSRSRSIRFVKKFYRRCKRWCKHKDLLRTLSLALAVYGVVVMVVCLVTNTFLV